MCNSHSSTVSVVPSLCLVLALGAGLLGGCATEGVNPPAPSPPPRNLGLRGQGAHATVEVVDIIQPGRPESGNPDGRWTEIVVRITNSSGVHLVGREISLVSATGAKLPAVANPVALAEVQQHLTRLKEQAEDAAKLTSDALSSASTLAPKKSSSAASKVDPVVSSVQKLADSYHQQKIRTATKRAQDLESETRQRALATGARLSPGEHVQGSVFFALTPSPRKLIVSYEASQALHTVEVILAQVGAGQARPPEVAALPPASPAPPPPTPPAPSPAAPPALTMTDRAVENDLFYVVKAGDTLGAIALRVTGSANNWRRIAEYNDITSTAGLRVGATLKIPKSLVKDAPPRR